MGLSTVSADAEAFGLLYYFTCFTCVHHTVQCPQRPQEGVRFAEVRITSREPPNTLGAEPGTELRSSVKATGVPSRSAMDGFSDYL